MAPPHNSHAPPLPLSPIPTHASPASSSTPVSGASHPHPPPDCPANFSPFFTLISNPGSTAHKHPIVHYIFSDDDFDPVGEITLAAAEEEAVTTPTIGSGRSATGGLGKGLKGRETKDRVLIVDIGNDRETVVGAHSFSKEWQVVSANISSAPQWMAGGPWGDDESGSGTGGGAGASGGLMLTIEGTEVGLSSVGAKKAESVYELAEMFSERMALLKRVVEYSEKQTTTATP